jgi:hypothetical protein
VHTQINVSTPEEVFFPPSKGFFFYSSGTTADGEEKRVTPGLMARDYAF